VSAAADPLRILFVGDVFGTVGLTALLEHLPELRATYRPTMVVVNAENSANGSGTSARQAKSLLDAGVDVLTGGNHTLRQADLVPLLEREPRVLRPDNMAARAPGRGYVVVDVAGGFRVAVINLLGSVFMDAAHSPFAVVDDLVDRAKRETRWILVDIHAEATSEKVALSRHLDGRVTAVVGTHTHVQTADARVLSGGTAYMTDLGMTGPHDGVIGVRSDIVLRRFLSGTSGRFEPADGEVLIQGAIVEAGSDGLATSIAGFSVSGE
jgi:2',3'-cyclic-nucleotide 2'-phosphodiesterase